MSRKDGNDLVKGLAFLFYQSRQDFVLIIVSFKSASVVESLHLSTSMVEDPILSQIWLEKSVHVFMTCWI